MSAPLQSPAIGAGAGGPRRVLVTGGAGFRGQALVRELAEPRVALAHTLELVAYDLVDAPGMRTIRGDVLDRAGLDAALVGMDAVIHAATLVDWCDFRAAELERVNVGGTRTVLAAAGAAGIRSFLHTSSHDVLGGEGDVVDATEDRPYPTRFYDAYGRTKAEAERVVRASDLPAACRAGRRCGWGPSWRESDVCRESARRSPARRCRRCARR